MSLPTYWRWRRAPSWPRVERASRSASTSLSGRSSSARRDGVERHQRLTRGPATRASRPCGAFSTGGRSSTDGSAGSGDGVGRRAGCGTWADGERRLARPLCYDNRPHSPTSRRGQSRAESHDRSRVRVLRIALCTVLLAAAALHTSSDERLAYRPRGPIRSTSHDAARTRGFPSARRSSSASPVRCWRRRSKGARPRPRAEVSQACRTERDRAPRRDRDDHLQPRQGRERLGVRGAAPRPRQHRRFFADAAIRDTVDKALAIARYTAEDPAAGLADPARLRAQLAGPRSRITRGTSRWSRPSSWAARRSARRSPSTGASPIPKAPRSRAANRNSSTPTAPDSSAAIAARAITSIASVIGDRRRRACSAITGTRPRARRRISNRPQPWVARPASARFDAWAEGSSARSSAPSCSRPPKRWTSSATSCRRCRAAACIASRRSCPSRSARRSSAPHVQLREEPHLLRGRGSAPFDSEGVATAARDVVRDGVVQGYFLGSYSARKLGMASTGNAGGSHNLVLSHGQRRSARRCSCAWDAAFSSPSSWGMA